MKIITFLRDYFSKKDVKKVILFGSFAKGDNSKRSDIDLIVIYNTEKKFFYRYKDFWDLYQKIPYQIDLLTYTPSEWLKIKDRPFFKEILKEGKVIYEQREESKRGNKMAKYC